MNDDADFLARLREEFLQEASDLLDCCEEAFLNLEHPSNTEARLAEIFRAVHTIKGSGAAVGLVDLVEFAHELENCLSALRTFPEQLTFDLTSLLLSCLDALRIKIRLLFEGNGELSSTSDLVQKLQSARSEMMKTPRSLSDLGGQGFGFFEDEESGEECPTIHRSPLSEIGSADSSQLTRRETACIKVDASRIESVLNLVGELVVLKSQLINKTESYGSDAALASVVSLLDKTVRELQDKALSIRLTPVKSLFMKMQRMARDLSVKMGKTIEFDMSGEDTELDRIVVESLNDPLLHLVRNAIDHGVESASVREKANKNPTGRIRLSAMQSSGRIIVRLSDDGTGIHRENVVRKAIAKGMLQPDTQASKLNDHDVFALLLTPGFSTAEAVTDISGRGVGLDVVRNQIEKLKGTLLIQSEEGRGSSFEISLPLTASVTDGMIVEIAGQMLVIPMEKIRELVKIENRNIVELGAGQQVLNVRGQMLPIVASEALLSPHAAQPKASAQFAVVLSHQDRLFALRIASVIGQMQVIMKPMNAAFPRELIAGATILGDGQVALIADVEGLIRSHMRSWAKESGLSPGRAAA